MSRFPTLRTWPRIAAALLAVPLALQAQQDTTSPASGTEPYWNRFSVGARVSILFNDLMNSETLSSSTSTPVVSRTNATTSTSNQLGAGATFEFALLDRLSLALDILYRKAGYKSVLEIVEGSENVTVTQTFERTRATYWDVPLVLRIYDAPRQEKRSRAFLDVGVAYRRLSNIRTFSEFLLPDNTSAQSQTPVTPRHSTLPGVVLGGGFQLVGASAVKVVPQIRFTRWLGSTFDAPPTQSRRNQFELLFGIAF